MYCKDYVKKNIQLLEKVLFPFIDKFRFFVYDYTNEKRCTDWTKHKITDMLKD